MFISRFIPIHTGNSQISLSVLLRLSVHPHTHGELAVIPSSIRFIIGSSPYTRGTRFDIELSEDGLRFIPIHTGNSHLP
ncbi:conserved hypothetical protein [Methanospirillum hungatei JF-1]|nr:conserved hypothetical protein [Methanospirillum hungatei JF-1]